MHSTFERRKSKIEGPRPSESRCGWRSGRKGIVALLRDRGFSLRAVGLLADTGLDSNETSYPSDRRGMLVYWVWARERSALMRPAGPPGHRSGPHYVQDREAKRQLAKAGREVQRALRDAEHEIRHAVDKTHDEVHRAIDEVRGALLANDDDENDTKPPVPQPSAVEREDAEGLPVAIVPGTRVTEAQAVPPVPPRPAIKTRVVGARPRPQPAALVTEAETTVTLDGQISATPERVSSKPASTFGTTSPTGSTPEVPRSWAIPGARC